MRSFHGFTLDVCVKIALRKSSKRLDREGLNPPEGIVSTLGLPLLCSDVALPQPFRRCRRIKADHATDPEVRHPSALGQGVDVFTCTSDQFGQFTGGPCLLPALDQRDDVRRNSKRVNPRCRQSPNGSCDVFVHWSAWWLHWSAWWRGRRDAIRLTTLCWPERLPGYLLGCGATPRDDLNARGLGKLG